MKLRPARRQGPPGFRVCSSCHRKDCRPSRPLCRRMRLVKPNQRPCQCSGGCHHTHRTGGHPQRIHHPNHATLTWAELERPIRKAG